MQHLRFRKIGRLGPLLALGLLHLAGACAASQPQCPPANGVALQVLGSGGPIADDARASSSYLVWRDGESVALIDAGGGAFLRFGEAAANFSDLEFAGLSHFHTDHSADFPALLKSGLFSGRERDLVVAGPDGEGAFPGLRDWLSRMVSTENGAYAYLGGYLDGSGAAARLDMRQVADNGVVRVFESATLSVNAMRVPHGIVPAVAFRVQAGPHSIVFATDQNGTDQRFVEFARGATALVMHMVVPQDASGVAMRLHARPATIGEIAAEIAPGTLLLSHFMARSLRELDRNVAIVQQSYDGEVMLAEDLLCVVLD